MKLSINQIEAAVKWWQEAFRNPKFDNLGKSREREPPEVVCSNEMASLMASAYRTHPDDDQVRSFGESLRQLLASDGRAVENGLYVDYAPGGHLSVAVSAAGMVPSTNSLPWKTGMRFSDGGVQVKCGYGEDYVEILKEKA